MSNSEEKVSKNNGLGLGIDPMERLASFKPPRDFTLGAAKAKKVFTPNLNVSRNKNKGPAAPGSRDNKKEDKGKRDRKNDRNRNRHGPEIIRSSGVFSEGVGKGAPRHSSLRSHVQESSSPATLQRPTIRVKDVVKIDKELEEQKISEVLRRGDFVEDEAEDFKRSLDCDAPIRLPMEDIGWSLNKIKANSVTVKQEVQVKTEPTEEDLQAKEAKPIPAVKKEFFEDTDVVDLLKSDQPTLILIKFPDTLPGRVGDGDEGPRRRQPQQADASSSTDTEQESPPVETKCNLRSLEEGRIGKLQVRRSGRVTLLFGDTSFESSLSTTMSPSNKTSDSRRHLYRPRLRLRRPHGLRRERPRALHGRQRTAARSLSSSSWKRSSNRIETRRQPRPNLTVTLGTKSAYHQEVVSVATDEATRSANVIGLGALTHKLTVFPDWEGLFSKAT